MEKQKNNHLPSTIPMPLLPNIFSEFFSSKVSDLRKEIDSQLTAPQPLGSEFDGIGELQVCWNTSKVGTAPLLGEREVRQLCGFLH